MAEHVDHYVRHTIRERQEAQRLRMAEINASGRDCPACGEPLREDGRAEWCGNGCDLSCGNPGENECNT